ncbi:hypothetical protein E3J74_00580 [Candidatus Bathyarchaeota archaeon]|nr:MAG: hypothetical protein E3J74_00580 [Candidatus Bathyarchaeota archaeon]
MAAWNKITVMQNLVSRLDGPPKCKICGHHLYVGEKAWAHICPRKRESYTVYYCLICYSKLWI